MKTMLVRWSLAVATLWCLGLSSAWAQCGVTMSCGGGGGGSILPPTVCKVNGCFASDTAKQKFETDNNCKFPAGDLCAGKPMDKATQCCGKDANGSAAIKDKQAKVLDEKFDWTAYQKSCPAMKQSEASADALWNQCEVGKKHSVTDDWLVREVVPNSNNPKARSFCIDGCSTPPAAINISYNLNIFLKKDKDNPTGHENSSFYGACKAHDMCYQTCGADKTQLACDTALKNNSLNACNAIPSEHVTLVTTLGVTSEVNTRQKCISAASRMFNILSDLGLGKAAFDKRKQQMCQCC